MARALKCDRCEKLYDLLLSPRTYYIGISNYCGDYAPRLDLCPECYEEFLKFLNVEEDSDGSGDT